MLEYTVTFKDVEKNEVSRTLYFNLSKDEMTALELEHMDDGGFIKWFTALHEKAMTGYKESYDELKELIVYAYGERDPDDKTVFDKSDEAKARFRKNLSKTAFMDALLEDPMLFATFFKEVFPLEFLNMEKIDESIEKAMAEAKAEVEAMQAAQAKKDLEALEASTGNSTAEPSQNG